MLTLLICSYDLLQVLRVQSPDGTKRVEIADTSNLRELYELVHGTFALSDYGFALYKERNYTKEVLQNSFHVHPDLEC